MDGDGEVDGLGDGGAMHADCSRCFCSLSSREENVHSGVFGPRELQALFHLAREAAPANEDCCRDALIALGNIAITSKNQQAIARLGGIPCLAQALGSPFSSCQLYAARALYRLGVVEANQPKLVEAGAVPPLIALAEQSSDTEVAQPLEHNPVDI